MRARQLKRSFAERLQTLAAIAASVCLVGGGAAGLVLGSAAPASADTVGPINFEGYTLGSVNGQDGWTSTGTYDQAIVANAVLGAPASFQTKSLRISDAFTSGTFGDQTYSKPTVDAAGEPTADAGGFPTGTLQNHFDASFDFASVTPASEQSGLHISVSPDRGDGARMSYVRIEDSPAGWNLFFDDYQDVAPLGSPGNLDAGCGTGDDFTDIPIASGVDRSAPHNLGFVMDLLPGGHNDVVSVLLDGNVIHTGTSWEDYYRYCPESGGGTGGPRADQSRIVRNLELREGGTAHLTNAGKGFLIDNMQETTAQDCTTTCYVDGASGNNANTGQLGDPVQTIQAGVNRVDPNGTAHVAAGTYDEAVTIDHPLTLLGANAGVAGTATRGPESLVERLSGESGSVFNITTSNQVTIDGFEGQFNGTEQNGGLLLSLASANHLTFSNNVVDNSVYVNSLVFDDSAATSTLHNNLFTLDQQTGSPGTGVVATWGDTGSATQDAVSYTGNTFSHLTDSDGVPAINLNTVSGVVSGNTFQDIHQYGILLADKLGNLSISNNLFDSIHNDTPLTSGNRGSGIRTFAVPNFVGPVSITGNTFSNDYHGVRVANDGTPADLSSGDLVVKRNAFTTNTAAGISLATGTTGTMDGTCNWWGQSSGPATGQVDGAVTTAPWLISSNLAGNCIPVMKIGNATVPVVEGNSGTTPVNLTVSLDRKSSQTVTAFWNTSNGTAGAGDYTGAFGQVSFAPGQTTQTITVNVKGDTALEDYEYFSVKLSGPTNALLANAQEQIEIQNDEKPTMTVNNVSVTEGSKAIFTATLAQRYYQPIVVSVSSAGGTAHAPGDFGALPAGFTITIAAGTTSKTVSVQTRLDSTTEPDETFTLTFSSSSINNSPRTATGTILANNT